MSLLPKPGEGFYVTRPESPYRQKEEADARARGIRLRELKSQTEAMCLAFLTKGPDMHEATSNGSDLIEHLPNHPELSERLELRASKEDVERWRQAGEARGLTLSAYVRQAARELALHPALARGALEGAWLELAQQGVNTLGRIMAELADRSDLIRSKPVEVVLRVVPAAAAAELGGSKPPRRKKLAMKHKRASDAKRKKPRAR